MRMKENESMQMNGRVVRVRILVVLMECVRVGVCEMIAWDVRYPRSVSRWVINAGLQR